MISKDSESCLEVDTKDSFSQEHFYKAFKLLTCATHWKGEDGVLHKLTPSLKLVYSHRFEQYNSYTQQGLPYFENNRQVSDFIGIGYSTVADQINPLLKKMGLLEVTKVSFNKYKVVVNPVSEHKGSLLNPTLTKANYSDKKIDKSHKEWIQYQINSELIEKNIKAINLIDEENKKIRQDMFVSHSSNTRVSNPFKLAPTSEEDTET